MAGRRVPHSLRLLELRKSNAELKVSSKEAVSSAVDDNSAADEEIAADVLWLNTCTANDIFIF